MNNEYQGAKVLNTFLTQKVLQLYNSYCATWFNTHFDKTMSHTKAVRYLLTTYSSFYWCFCSIQSHDHCFFLFDTGVNTVHSYWLKPTRQGSPVLDLKGQCPAGFRGSLMQQIWFKWFSNCLLSSSSRGCQCSWETSKTYRTVVFKVWNWGSMFHTITKYLMFLLGVLITWTQEIKPLLS